MGRVSPGTATSVSLGTVSVSSISGNVTVVQPTASNFNATVVGPAASGAATSGNPVRVGANFNTTQPTVTNGQTVDLQATSRGGLIVATGVDAFSVRNSDASGNAFNAGSQSDGLDMGSAAHQRASALGYIYNGTTWDRVRTFNAANATTGTGLLGAGMMTLDAGDSTTARRLLALAPGDGYSNAMSLYTMGFNMVYNGSSWDRVRSAGSTGSVVVGGNVASAATDSGNPVKVGGKYTSSLPTFTDGQRGDLAIDTKGSMRTTLTVNNDGAAIQNAADNADGVAVSSSGNKLVGLSRGTVYNGTSWDRQPGNTSGTFVIGNVAHDAADASNPIKVGLKAETSPKGITLVADGDRTDWYADADGLAMVKLNTSNADLISERVTNTDGTSTAFSNFSAVANTKNYVTSISIYNSSATDGFVDFRSGTGGAVLWTMAAPALGGSVISSASPLFATAANTALAYDTSGALSTIYISASGFQSKV